MLARHIPTHGRIVHLVGSGEGEDVRGPRDTARGTGGAVANTELVKVQPDLTNVVRLPFDKIDTGPSNPVNQSEVSISRY